ncbi:acyl-CoA dehydrogenase family protein [Hydrogenophaga palleronii]|uniref:acyl-CoA dehydrogenase family protein n=1 Tax=Hydrogenophaga palleronii TaxID=65655 RepID=UPI0008242BE0|nr:acyl-CoA dehydrogenase family protein [Hydrogenophaga palleronii]
MVDFAISTEDRMIQDTVRKFVDKELIPREREYIQRDIKGESGFLPLSELRQLQRLGKEAGIWGIDCPETYGGLNLSPFTQALINEELGRTFIKFRFGGTAPSVLYLVNDEQKKEYLLPYIAGERQGAFALSEPGGGSDARRPRTTAVKQGDEWVINGEKTWISLATDADFAVVFATTRAEDGTEGVSAFLVDRSLGWTATPIANMGFDGTSSLHFNNVRVPARYLIGEVNKAFNLAMLFIYRNRGYNLAPKNVGAATRLLAMALEHAENRTTFGKKLAERENIQFMITESEVELRAARLLAWHAAWQASEQQDFRYAACAAKYYAAQMSNRVVDRVMQIHGAMGFAKETGIERWYRDLRVERIYEGSDEINLAWMWKDLQSRRTEIGQM